MRALISFFFARLVGKCYRDHASFICFSAQATHTFLLYFSFIFLYVMPMLSTVVAVNKTNRISSIEVATSTIPLATHPVY